MKASPEHGVLGVTKVSSNGRDDNPTTQICAPKRAMDLLGVEIGDCIVWLEADGEVVFYPISESEYKQYLTEE